MVMPYMATGASTAQLAVILIDARKGVLQQTRRHSRILDLLGVRQIVVAINKMDLVDFSRDVFEQIKSDYQAFAARLTAVAPTRPVALSILDRAVQTIEDTEAELSTWRASSAISVADLPR